MQRSQVVVNSRDMDEMDDQGPNWSDGSIEPAVQGRNFLMRDEDGFDNSSAAVVVTPWQ